MEKIEGVYVGQERQVRMYGSITDTTWDSVYDQIITVNFTKRIDMNLQKPSNQLPLTALPNHLFDMERIVQRMVSF